MTAVLFAREDSAYKAYEGFEVYDMARDARTYCGRAPVIAHPPCRAWGILAHMANPREGERELAYFALAQVRLNGGILEHPITSRLWKEANLPVGMLQDEFGGFTLDIDQWDFGHVANKPTRFYICGVAREKLPPIPARKYGKAKKSMTGQVNGTKRATQYEREYTPTALIEWLKKITDLMTHNV
jgi:hypothetical protein